MKATAGLAILVLTIAGAVPAKSAPAADTDREAVLLAAQQFYAALNALFSGDVSLMEGVWSHADDVTYMGPGGAFLVGWDQVASRWKEQAAMKLGGEVQPKDMRVVVGRDLAVTYNFERGENVDSEGFSHEVSIRATNVFRKENGNWKMIGHHTDLLSFLTR